MTDMAANLAPYPESISLETAIIAQHRPRMVNGAVGSVLHESRRLWQQEKALADINALDKTSYDLVVSRHDMATAFWNDMSQRVGQDAELLRLAYGVQGAGVTSADQSQKLVESWREKTRESSRGLVEIGAERIVHDQERVLATAVRKRQASLGRATRLRYALTGMALGAGLTGGGLGYVMHNAEIKVPSGSGVIIETPAQEHPGGTLGLEVGMGLLFGAIGTSLGWDLAHGPASKRAQRNARKQAEQAW